MNKATPDNRHLIIVLALAAIGCGPTATVGGSFGDGETGSTDSTEAPDDSFCVEEVPGQSTCWVPYGTSYAYILLACQVDAAVSGGVWSPAYDAEIEGYGVVSCHDVAFTDYTFCMTPDRVLLTITADGWEPELSAVVGLLDPTAAPC